MYLVWTLHIGGLGPSFLRSSFDLWWKLAKAGLRKAPGQGWSLSITSAATRFQRPAPPNKHNQNLSFFLKKGISKVQQNKDKNPNMNFVSPIACVWNKENAHLHTIHMLNLVGHIWFQRLSLPQSNKIKSTTHLNKEPINMAVHDTHMTDINVI